MPNNFELDKIIGFFEADVLNLPTQAIPTSMNWIQTFLRRVLETTEAYFYQLKSSGKLDEYISIRFGYHRKKDDTLCIAVYPPRFSQSLQK